MEYKTAKRMECLPFSGIPCSNGKSKQNAAGRREDHSPGDRTSGLITPEKNQKSSK